MSLKDFIKENFVLAVGLALPVLLVIVFFFAAVLPKSLATPPQYEVLFTTARYDYQNPPPYSVDFVVKDGTLMARVSKNTNKNNNWKKLMAFDAKEDTVREIPYDLSKIGDVADGSEIVLTEMKDMKIDNANKAPDGYAFDGASGYSGEPFGFFGGGYYNQSLRIKKGAVVFKAPVDGNAYNYYNAQFVGWIIGKK